jgi:protease-4
VLGSYEDALKIAARRAHLKADDYRVQRLPRTKSSVEKFLSRFIDTDEDDQAAAEARVMQTKLGPLYPAYHQYQLLMQMKGVQARLPYELEIK